MPRKEQRRSRVGFRAGGVGDAGALGSGRESD